MSKPKKTKMVGYYTCATREGTVTVEVPNDLRLPQAFNLHVKGEKDKVHYSLVKQKVVKA